MKAAVGFKKSDAKQGGTWMRTAGGASWAAYFADSWTTRWIDLPAPCAADI